MVEICWNILSNCCGGLKGAQNNMVVTHLTVSSNPLYCVSYYLIHLRAYCVQQLWLDFAKKVSELYLHWQS
jgi:hypothetical protein